MMTIEGDLTINNITEIKSEIQKQFNPGSPLSITISGIKEMDITFLQLLINLESAPDGISLDIAPGDINRISEFLKSYGYNKELNISNLRK